MEESVLTTLESAPDGTGAGVGCASISSQHNHGQTEAYIRA